MAHAAWEEIGGKRHYFKSTWEVNYARLLQWLKETGEIKEWEYEVETFWFDGIRRGTVSYMPDFRITLFGGALEYHEIKGRMDPKSKTKIKRMARYHPKIKLIVIDADKYKLLCSKVSSLVPGWVTHGKKLNKRKRGGSDDGVSKRL